MDGEGVIHITSVADSARVDIARILIVVAGRAEPKLPKPVV